MKERPILFSAPMVRAILDGRKTVTRRIVKPQPVGPVANVDLPPEHHVFAWHPRKPVIDRQPMPVGTHRFRLDPETQGQLIALGSPYGQPSDRLWVRETWAPWSEHLADRGEAEALADAKRQVPWAGILYGADRAWEHAKPLRWRPSIHMPRWVSRIALEIVSVRVERLHDITEEDARAEGVTPFPNDPEGDCWTDGKHRTAFNYLWNEINGWNPNSFDSNPWVWRVEFRSTARSGRSVWPSNPRNRPSESSSQSSSRLPSQRRSHAKSSSSSSTEARHD